MDYGGGGHRLHETCERIVQTEFRAIRRDHRHRHRPQCAAVSSSLVWTSLLYERCSRGVTLLIPTGILHDVPWGSRLLGSHSFGVDFASVKSVSLWQLLRPGPPQTVQRAFGAQRLLPIVHSCHQPTTLSTGPVKHAERGWACHYDPSLALVQRVRLQNHMRPPTPSSSGGATHSTPFVSICMHTCTAQESCAAERADVPCSPWHRPMPAVNCTYSPVLHYCIITVLL
jgi:hypothetical protein